jgi:seryl-tRNA synthetase
VLDPKILRNDLEGVTKILATRGYVFDVARYQELEVKRKEVQDIAQQLQNEKNVSAKIVGQAKAKGEDIQPLLAAVASLGDKLKDAEKKLAEVQQELDILLSDIPNLPDESVPVGRDENDNRVESVWGEPRNFDFAVKDHLDLGEALNIVDMEAGSKLSGARFLVLKGLGARLQRALIQLMLNTHIEEFGYEEVYVPYLVHSKALYGTGQLPKFAADFFSIKDSDFVLIPTAEVPVTNLVADSIVDISDLPIKRVCHTPCFRSEAGSYGRDTRGMIRLHQFEKVELVQCVRPEMGMQTLEAMRNHAAAILEKLNLPYRVITLCTGDMGFSAQKTYDLEVWIPSQNCYREISSVSLCGDFQARRMQARYRDPVTGKPKLLATLNGSGLALSRTVVAILENYQRSDGHIDIPEVLKPYMGGVMEI